VRLLLAASLLGCCAACVYTAGTIALAAHFSEQPDLAGLTRAARLRPENADYQFHLGQALFIAQQSAEKALSPLLRAVSADPYHARSWFALAAAYAFLGDSVRQRDALDHATAADPTTPEFAWQAANLYLTQGDTNGALHELRSVLQYDQALAPAAIRLAWRIQPDMESLLRTSLPPSAQVYSMFLEFLVSQKEPVAAATLWQQIASRRQPIDRRYIFEYVRYLVLAHDPGQAALVWSQAAPLALLQSYQPSPLNLMVNGDFSSDFLNGGFDWLYQQTADVRFALDPTQSRGGHRSLLVALDSRHLSDTGLRQMISITPGTAYEFSAFFKTQDLQGAGGPEFILQDAYTQQVYFTSDDLKDADYWKRVGGRFTTGPDTRLVILHLQRIPAGSPIRGKLWIDDIRIAPAAKESAQY